MPKPRDEKLYDVVKHKVKRSVERWPSAYASGQVVQMYKKKYKAKYGPKSKPYTGTKKETELARWYKEKWVDLCRPKDDGTYAPCGRAKMKGKYPSCRPSKRVTNDTPVTVKEFIKLLGKPEIEKRCARKQTLKKKTMKPVQTK